MTMQITRKKFLDLGLGTLGAIGLGACGGDDEGDTGNDTGSSGGDDDSGSNTNPSSPTSDPDDDGSSSVTIDPSESSSTGIDPTAESSTSIDPTAEGSTTDPDSSSGPGDSSSTGTAAGCESDPTASFDLHMHTLMIPLADVVAGVDQSYVAGGGHTHDVNVTAEDFAELLAGNQVIVMSEPGGAGPHSHMVTLICE